ncbi:MAG: 50S ribosomal protein L32e [Thermofilaceae archaeon]|nr:50S ribosomal protein L32e [Thermofilaceae archaeon]MDW8003731.1 50S ribosomal protein L32e [Thermofilaceae archaeon]
MKPSGRLIRLKNEKNRKRPRFVRMNSWFLKRLDDSWRNPRRSLDNKIRLEKKGFPPRVKVGYRGPSEVRGLHPSGLIEVLVATPAQLNDLNPRRHIVRIASSVGARKRGEILKRAKELGLRVANSLLE